MNPTQNRNFLAPDEKTTSGFHNTTIISADGTVLSTVERKELDETKTTTLNINPFTTTKINNDSESKIPDTSTTVVNDTEISEKKYEFSYSELAEEVDKQVKGKLQDFLDKNEEIINGIKNELGHHKESVNTKVDSFQKIQDVFTTNNQFSVSTTLTRIGLIVGAVIVGVQIYIEVVNEKFNDIKELQKDVSLLQSKVEDLEEDSDENSKEVKQILEMINKINVNIAKLSINNTQENNVTTE